MPTKKKPAANRNIKLLLNESVRHLGRVGDVVEVKPGYARNYLIPHGLAVQPTPQNLKRVEEKRREVERIERDRREKQAAVLEKLAGFRVTLERRANERGNLYGSVSASDLALALNEAGVTGGMIDEIIPDDINLHGKIDHVGDFTAEVRFAEDLKQDFDVTVVADAESRAAMEEYAAQQKQREAASVARDAAEAAESATR